MKKLEISQMENLQGEKSWGQNTMNCINDAYTNKEWASVAGWITTAFVPEMAVVAAATCAAIN